MFCVAPLLFLAFSLWAVTRAAAAPRAHRHRGSCAGRALLLTLDLKSLLQIGILSDTFGLIPLLRLSGRVDGGVDTVELLMLGGGVLLPAWPSRSSPRGSP